MKEMEEIDPGADADGENKAEGSDQKLEDDSYDSTEKIVADQDSKLISLKLLDVFQRIKAAEDTLHAFKETV